MEKESNCKARERVKLEDEVKELKNLVEELKPDAIEKDTHLDHLQKSSDELCSSLGKAKEEAIRELGHPACLLFIGRELCCWV